MKKRRALIFSLLPLAVLICIAFGLVMRGYWREQAGRELILAIKANDTDKALDALRAHADPNVRDQSDVTPSFRAYLSKLWQQMRGIKPQVPNKEASALGLAVEHDNTVVVEALLARGAKAAGEKYEEEVELPDGGTHFTTADATVNISLLEVAARHGDAAIVQTLARHGCDVNEVNTDHATALFFADNAETVKTLIDCGANPAAKDTSERTALDFNIYSGNEDGADALLDNGVYDRAAMMDAIAFDHMEPLKRMLARGWKVDAPNEYGSTPLEGALTSGGRLNLDAALLLIEHGANVNHRDAGGTTPLMLAADGGRYPPMEDQSPLVMETLLKRGAKINAQDSKGRTTLMISALHLRPVLVRLLLKHGARANLKTKKGETALSMAHRRDWASMDNDRDRSEVIRLLKKAGAKE